MVDWKEVAETLRGFYQQDEEQPMLEAAIALCLLAAKLPPGEAELVLEAAAEEARQIAWDASDCEALREALEDI